MNTAEKTCFKCGECKPLSGFYKHSRMADGHLNKCKECTKSDVMNHRLENIENVREHDRKRAKRPERIAAMRRVVDSYARRNPDRVSAVNALNNAVRDRKILKPVACWKCGDSRRVHGHHAAYDMPLGVTWLCQVCHKACHTLTNQIIREQQAAPI